MFKHSLTTMALTAMLIPASLQAKDIKVTPTSFAEAWTAAADGDVLLMETGKYDVAFQLQSNKTLTLRAADGAEVVLQQGPSAVETAENVGIIFDGITIRLRKGDYFMRILTQSMKTLEFRNCSIEDIPRCLFNATDDMPIDQIVIDNCIIANCGNKGYCLIWSKGSIKKLIVNNSTLYNYLDGESFFYQSNRRSGCNMELTFTNNTVSKWGIGDGDTSPFFNITDKLGRNSTFLFRNNIFSAAAIAANRPNIITTSGGTVTAENNLIVDYGGYSTSVNATQNVSDLNIDDLKLKDGIIGFVNADSGNFTLPAKSPLRKAGTDKQPVGDPRWAK